ncbi:MAG TPA: penicillin acylase family protein [Thermoleophilaceae bacterium]|nr:penicillin acylase family protein [Thermoleophilaceae bacterium]
MKRFLLLAAAIAAFVAVVPSAHAVRDFARTALNIIPSGQYGDVPVVPEADDQARLYDGLTPEFDQVSRGDLNRFFKSERLGTKGQGPLTRERVRRKGLRIVRDRHNVPHIFGRTDDAVTWGAGWVLAKDRRLLLEQARYNSRVAVVDAPGLSAIGLITGLESFEPSRRTEREVLKEVRKLKDYGRAGRRLLHDIDVYVKGINAYYRTLPENGRPEPWTRKDVIALNAVKSELFGEGGGGEVDAAQLLDGLQGSLGADRGLSVWNDLRQRQDPETPVSIPGNFPYAKLPGSRRGNVTIDNGSFEPVPVPGSTTARAAGAEQPLRGHASNVLMVAGKRSRSGNPLFVGGPQIGYFYPGLTLEMDLRGPGWKARGATSAPFPGYILIGRREDFVWTLTSAGADIVDIYVETLCGGSDTRYRYKGRCRAMTPFHAGMLDNQAVRFNRTVHGPVVGYATVDGRRVAISRKRSSYLLDGVDLLLFRRLTRGRIENARQFIKAAGISPQTFNTFYADHRQVAQVTTGRLPQRAAGVDSGLPTDGRGRFEWRGFLPAKDHPQAILSRGVLNNWNNKPARGFPAADDQWAYGPLGRVDLLNMNTAKVRRHTLATLTGAMNAAATQDVRTMTFVPLLAEFLRGAPAPSPRAMRMLELLQEWRAQGGSRLDRDGDGKIDHPGAAVLDSAWPRLADAAMRPVLGQALADQLHSTLHRRFDLPPGGMFGGWHMYMSKDLRTLLGRTVRGPLRNRYCGNGDANVCRADLWAAMEAAGAELQLAQGADPNAWRADANRERITFLPGLLPYTMRYTNRPSGIQQVIEFKGHRQAIGR